MKTKVTTITGREEEKSDCRKMKGIYYFKGDYKVEDSGECYFINNKYYKFNTGYIIYDHTVKEYILKSDAVDKGYIEKGIVGFNNSIPIFGSFTINPLNNFVDLIYKDKHYICISEDIINKKIFKESLRDGRFYHRKAIRAEYFVFPTECDKDIKNSLPYDSRSILKSHIKKYNEQYNPNYCSILDFFNRKEVDLTKGLSFGLEFETTEGFIPERITDKIGLIPLKDGSVKGLEYVTIPLEGNKGLQTVLDSLKQLEYRTNYDNNCSLHLHIGNIPRTEVFFLAAFKMLFYLQDDIFKLFPFHKKDNYNIKRKAYTKPLPLQKALLMDNKITKDNINYNFDILYHFLSAGQRYEEVDFNLKNVKSHPSDPGANSKWNIKSRYYWVNLIPLLFGNKETIEFRIHTPTVDANKVMNYLLMCFSIIDFIKRNQDEIIADSTKFIDSKLCNIFSNAYHKDSKNHSLVNEFLLYHDYRKQHFFRKTAQGDLIALEDEFSFKGYLNWNKYPKISEEIDKKSSGIEKSINDKIKQIIAEGFDMPLAAYGGNIVVPDPVPVPEIPIQENVEAEVDAGPAWLFEDNNLEEG